MNVNKPKDLRARRDEVQSQSSTGKLRQAIEVDRLSEKGMSSRGEVDESPSISSSFYQTYVGVGYARAAKPIYGLENPLNVIARVGFADDRFHFRVTVDRVPFRVIVHLPPARRQGRDGENPLVERDSHVDERFTHCLWGEA